MRFISGNTATFPCG